MRRWMFNIFAAVSLSLCVATIALWVRSFHRHDAISRLSMIDDKRGPVRLLHASAECGGIALRLSYYNLPPERTSVARGGYAEKAARGFEYSVHCAHVYPWSGYEHRMWGF